MMPAWLNRPSRHPILWLALILTAYSLQPVAADVVVMLLEALS